MALSSFLRLGSTRALAVVLLVRASYFSAANSDGQCDTSSLLQASLGTVVRDVAYDARSRRSHKSEEHFHATELASMQAERKLDVVVQSHSQLVSIGTAAKHQQSESTAADEAVAEQQQPESDAADESATEQQQPEGDAADAPVAEQQQPEGDAADQAVAEQQQPESDAADESATEQQQPEGHAADPTTAAQQQPEGDAPAPTDSEEQQPVQDAADETAAQQQQSEGNAADEIAAEQQQSQGDAVEETATEQQQPDGDSEERQQEGVASKLPAEVRHNGSTVTADWRKEYPFEEEPPSATARPWVPYAVGAGLVIVLIAAARLLG